jgi:hypothetical protein
LRVAPLAEVFWKFVVPNVSEYDVPEPKLETTRTPVVVVLRVHVAEALLVGDVDTVNALDAVGRSIVPDVRAILNVKEVAVVEAVTSVAENTFGGAAVVKLPLVIAVVAV